MRSSAGILVVGLAVPWLVSAQAGEVRHVNPAGLVANPAFSQMVVVSGAHRTIYVGGQNAVDSAGTIVGPGDVRAQTVQALANLQRALESVGADLRHVVRWQVLVVDGAPLEAGVAGFRDVWANRGPPPAITLAVVRALAHPAFLVEIDAIAVVPEAVSP